MHRYTPKWDDDPEWEPPSEAEFTYLDAHDVAEYAALDRLTTWYTYPHIWHLDERGEWCCQSKGSSFDSVRTFAERPAEMLACRLTDLGSTCPDFWLILEPRQSWRADRYEPTERDAEAFTSLRRSLADHGITLLDAMVFTDDLRWWSLHELATGSPVWNFAPSARPITNRAGDW